MDNQPKNEKEFDEKFPVTTHYKRKFDYTSSELKEFGQYSTAYVIAKMLEQSANTLSGTLLEMVAKRVNLKNSPAVQILPTQTGILVWEPKLWCSVCNNMQAMYKYGEKPVCESCLAKLQEEAKQKSQIKVEEKKEEPKKKKS